MSDTLYLIPARGGSKGVPGKNSKPLAGKPLICYSIDIARKFVPDEFICVSTDDDVIAEVVRNYGLKTPFRRPAELATDTAGSSDVIMHALNHYEQQGLAIDKIVLLQPTSPFRLEKHLSEALKAYDDSLDMVVSVKITDANPYYVLFEENNEGYLEKSKKQENFSRRQDLPPVYQVNGSIYIINVKSLKKYGSLSGFQKLKKYLMDPLYSVDIDTPLDWAFCEFLLKENHVVL